MSEPKRCVGCGEPMDLEDYLMKGDKLAAMQQRTLAYCMNVKCGRYGLASRFYYSEELKRPIETVGKDVGRQARK